MDSYSFTLPATQREFLQWLEAWVQVDNLQPNYETDSLRYFINGAGEPRGLFVVLAQATPERVRVQFAPFAPAPEDEQTLKWGWNFLEPEPESVTDEQRLFVAELARAVRRKWPEVSEESPARVQRQEHKQDDRTKVENAVRLHDFEGDTWGEAAEKVGMTERHLYRLRKKYRPDTLRHERANVR